MAKPNDKTGPYPARRCLKCDKEFRPQRKHQFLHNSCAAANAKLSKVEAKESSGVRWKTKGKNE